MALADETSRQRSRFGTRDEAHGRFNDAEWLAEHVLENKSGGATFPYPQTSPLRFAQLRVNGTAPDPATLLSHWMSLPGHDLAPTVITADTFTIDDATLSRPAATYLRLVEAINRVSDRFDAQAQTWSPSTSRAEIQHDTAPFVAATLSFDRDLNATRWPAIAQSRIRALIRANESSIAPLRDAAAIAEPHPHQWRTEFNTTQTRVILAARATRRSLGAPSLSPATPSSPPTLGRSSTWDSRLLTTADG